MKRFVTLLFILIISMLLHMSFGDVVFTSEEQQWLDAHPVINYSPDYDYAPFEFSDDKGNISGIAPEYIEIIFNELGIDYNIIKTETWADALEFVREKKTDILVGSKTESRLEYMEFSTPFIEVPAGIITRSEQPDRLVMDDLKGQKVATVMGWVTNDYLKENYPEVIIVPYPTAREALAATSFGETYAVILNLATVSYEIERNMILNLKVVGESGLSYKLTIGVRKDYPELVSIINKVIESIPDKEKDGIYRKWVTIRNVPFYKTRLFVNMLIVILISASLSILWIVSLKSQVKKRTNALELELQRSEKMKAEIEEINKKLVSSENELRKIIDLVPHMIFIKDYDGKYVLANKTTAELFDTTIDNLTGKVVEDFMSNVSKEQLDFFLERDRNVIDNQKRIYIDEEKFTDIHGNVKYCMTTKLPIEIKELGEVCALTVGIDITKERNAKLEVMKVHNDLDEVQSKLIESEKQAALGAMMAGISHEINTPIGLGVTSITYLASVHDKVQTAFDDNSLKKSELETYLASSFEVIESIECNLVNAAELINSFKKMAINQLSDEVTVFNMRECIESVLTSLRHRLKRTKHKIDVVCDNSMMLRSNPGAFSQIFTNFIMNSIIHGFEDIEEGNITIEVTRLDNKLLVKYSDDGCGMSKEHIEKIFDPFFTTKKDSGGSGLGMGVVASLVKQSLDGEITCESEIGKGMTFVMAFPLE